jgi:hypothetical protein
MIQLDGGLALQGKVDFLTSRIISQVTHINFVGGTLFFLDYYFSEMIAAVTQLYSVLLASIIWYVRTVSSLILGHNAYSVNAIFSYNV